MGDNKGSKGRTRERERDGDEYISEREGKGRGTEGKEMEWKGKGRDGKGKGKGSGDYVKKVNLKGMELEGRWREVEGRTIDCKVQCGFYGLHLQYRLCPAIQGSHRHIVPKGACLTYIYI